LLRERDCHDRELNKARKKIEQLETFGRPSLEPRSSPDVNRGGGLRQDSHFELIAIQD